MQLQVKMPENNRNNVVRGEQTKNKVPCNIFRGFEVERNLWLMFSRPNHNTKGVWNILSR